MSGKVTSVNVGRPAPFSTGRRVVRSAIAKRPVQGRVALRDDRVAGDEQGDPVNHGGPAQAVYAYAVEDIAFWEAELGRPLGPAFFGENLTIEGLDVNGARIGETWRVGTALLQVTAPRIPCAKLGARAGDPRFIKRFARALRPGPYLAIAEPGDVAAGDAVEVVDRPPHDVTVALMAEATVVDRAKLPLLEPSRPFWHPVVAEFLDGLDGFRLDEG